METNKIITVCAAVVKHDNKILVIQEAQKKAYGKFNIPGGHIEPYENIQEAVIREVKEETNIDITLEGFIGIYPHKIKDGPTIIKLIFSAKAENLDLKYPEDEILKVMWIDSSEFLQIEKEHLRSEDLILIIEDYQKNGFYDLDIVKKI